MTAAHGFLGATRRRQVVCIPFYLGRPSFVDPSARTDIAANCDRRRWLQNAMISLLGLRRGRLGNPRAAPPGDPTMLAPAAQSTHRPYLSRSSPAALRGTNPSPVLRSA